MPVPSAPLCEMSAMLPGSGSILRKDALSPTVGRMMPRQLGPTTRIGLSRRISRMRLSESAPFAPVSEKPADTTIAPCTPAATHCASTSGTVAAGVATIARSISAGTSPMLLYACRPRIDSCLGLIG